MNRLFMECPVNTQPRIAILDLSFHWPPTGGSWVDIAQISKGLVNHGAKVQIFVPRIDTGGLKRGRLTSHPPVPVRTIPVTLRQFHALSLPARLARPIREWAPTHVLVTNTFAMAPWLIRQLRGLRVFLRIYGYEMFCPFYMSLWPKGPVSQWARLNPTGAICPRDFFRSPAHCTFCALRGMGRELLPRWMNPFSHEYVASLAFAPFYRHLAIRALDMCEHILVSNQYTASLAEMWKEKVRVVPGGVDVHVFYPPESPTESPEPIVLMPGRVEDPRKGYAVFKDLVQRIVDQGISCRAVVTDPRYDDNSPHIESLGWSAYDQMARLYRDARVVVIPTVWPEPFGLVALEAMASGVPVVASRIGGLSDLIVDKETGFLVPPGDSALFAERVALLLKDANLCKQMSEKARKRALSFSWERVIARHYLPLFGMH